MAVPGVMGSIRWTDSGQRVQKDYVKVKKDDTSALVLPSSTLTSLSGERGHLQHYFHPSTSAELSTQHKAPSLRARLDHSERLMSGIADRPGHKRDFSQYSGRLETFECGPEPWPRASPSPHRLALVGFYYTGYEHTVVCFLCEAEVSDWDDGKDPLIKHYNKNPNCSFILGEFSSELEKLLSEERIPHRSPHYASSSLRLHTFSNWQHSNLITSYQLASAGFFYTGHGLRVECFSCGLTIQDWKRGDLPLHVHRQHNPNCPFIGSLLSKESPESVVGAQQQPPTPSDYPASRAPDYSNLTVRIRSFKHLARNFPVSGERCAEAGLFFLRKPDVMKCFSCGVILRDWINGDIPEEKHREINPRCTFLLEAFPSKLIGVGEEREEGGDIDPSTLPEPEFDEEDLERMSMVERAKAKSQQLDEDIGEAAHNLSKLSVNSPTSQPNIGSLEATEYSDTGSMCVVCMDAPLEMVLIPCRHMCVCEGCSKHLISCPMCRRTVQDALKEGVARFGMAGKVRVLLRDINSDLVAAWNDPQAFGADKYKEDVQISLGDIFEGAPSADAIVSPANSFGFMDGGIDMVYTNYFGWQMQERLQDLLRSKYDGELPVGCAVILPAYPSSQDLSKLNIEKKFNGGQPIRYLISAPTMRIPTNVSKTTNAYLAFRAVLREVYHHNEMNPDDPIKTVLCPGLGTAVGRMPYLRCAVQMRTAFDAVIHKDIEDINRPTSLSQCCSSHVALVRVGDNSSTRFSSKAEFGELFVPS